MIVLALDTATEACSAALWVDGEVVQRLEVAPRRHGELILGMLEAVLAEAGVARSAVEVIAFGRGPGAFTGVRIGVATAQAVALGLDRSVVAVSNLAALAQGHWRETGGERVLAAIDARMGEIYAGCYAIESGLAVARTEEAVLKPQDWRPPHGPWQGAGTGWSSYPEVLAALPGVKVEVVAGERLPQARDIAVLGAALATAGEAVDPGEAMPVYLRDQVAKRKIDT